MHKDKNGKIFASLTEVKNKTGDIFALVDEHGEITLTSYNKPRYKISKLSVEDRLGISDKPSAESKPEASEPKSTKKVTAASDEITEVEPEDPNPDDLVKNEDDPEIPPEDENPDEVVANEDDSELPPEDENPDELIEEEDDQAVNAKKEALKADAVNLMNADPTPSASPKEPVEQTEQDSEEHMEIKRWDRHNEREKSLLGRILKPLQ